MLKQSRPKLLVAEDWRADPVRLRNEAVGLGVAAATTPAAVPAVVAVDLERGVLLLERAPETWSDWRDVLLAGQSSVATGRWAGTTVGRWHAAGLGHTGQLQRRLTRAEQCFRELRIDPFHLRTAERLAELAAPLHELAAELLTVPAARRTFVHGDASPKNVLVDSEHPGSAWFIDFEVAHVGDPVFDVASLACALLLEPLRAPATVRAVAAVWLAVADGYRAVVPAALAPDWSRVARHTGALLLARVYGRSPDRLLDEAGRARAESAGRSLLACDNFGAAGVDITSARAMWDGAVAAAGIG